MIINDGEKRDTEHQFYRPGLGTVSWSGNLSDYMMEFTVIRCASHKKGNKVKMIYSTTVSSLIIPAH